MTHLLTDRGGALRGPGQQPQRCSLCQVGLASGAIFRSHVCKFCVNSVSVQALALRAQGGRESEKPSLPVLLPRVLLAGGWD